MHNEKILSVLGFLTSPKNLIGLLGGFLFTIIFYLGYQGIDNNFYEARDDGVITMSVGKNLVEHGFLGVNPSGPKVEASSSPVQTALYSFSYLITKVDYLTFAKVQTYIFTFLIGYLFISILPAKPILSFSLSALSAYLLTTYPTFITWHGSGMENPITNFLFLATIVILYSSIKKEKVNFWLAIIVFLATIARLDSVYHISILLVIYSSYWYFKHKNLQAFSFSIVVFALWVLFHLSRYFYFGDILPNTAEAQGISVSDRIRLLFSLDSNYILSSLKLSNEILFKNGGVLLIATLPLFLFVDYNKNKLAFLIIIIASLIATSYFNPFIFGRTRLDAGRTTIQMALFASLLLALAITSSKNIKASLLSLVLIIPAYKLLESKYNYKPYSLCCGTGWMAGVNDKFISIAKDNNIQLPTVSNPDLGVMTWRKNINVVDLGMLGTPIMANLKNGPLLADYYLNYAKPDIIASHGPWTRRYCSSIFTKKRFNQLYSQVGTSYDLNEVCRAKEPPPQIYWIRKDIKLNSLSLERLFLNDLQENLTKQRIKEEINSCAINEDCSYISRTVYKFIPQLREELLFDDVLQLFESKADIALLNGWRDGSAYKVIIKQIYDDMFNKDKGELIIDNDWKVYLNEKTLTYSKDNCSKKDYQNMFYLHFTPQDKNLISKDRSFINLDFNFKNNGIDYQGKCQAKIELPSVMIDKIRTGQYSSRMEDGKRKYTNHWNGEYISISE